MDVISTLGVAASFAFLGYVYAHRRACTGHDWERQCSVREWDDDAHWTPKLRMQKASWRGEGDYRIEREHIYKCSKRDCSATKREWDKVDTYNV